MWQISNLHVKAELSRLVMAVNHASWDEQKTDLASAPKSN